MIGRHNGSSTPAADDLLARANQWLSEYQSAARLARYVHQVTEFLLIAVSATTVVMAALHLPAVATASVAGTSLLLAGYREHFAPSETRLRALSAQRAIERGVYWYEMNPQGRGWAALRERAQELPDLPGERPRGGVTGPARDAETNPERRTAKATGVGASCCTLFSRLRPRLTTCCV